MRLKFIKTLAGAVVYRAGQVVDWKDEEEAKRLFLAGIAIPLPSERREKAVPNDLTEKRAIHSNKQSRRRTNKSE